MSTPDRPAVELASMLPFLLNRVGFRTFAEFEKHLAREGITVSMWRVAVALSNGRVQRIGDLVEPTALEPSTASRAVKALEALGYVVRERSQIDERVVGVKLTASGRKLVQRVAPISDEIERQIVADLEPSEIRTLKTLLARLGTRVVLDQAVPAPHRNGTSR